MKRNCRYVNLFHREASVFSHALLLCCSLLILFLAYCGNVKQGNNALPVTDTTGMRYTCPMHPEINKDAPGKCPICGMDLIVKEHKKIIYYCPMHPEIQQDHPGKCPKPECKGMDLVKKDSEDLLNTVLKPVNSSVLSSVKTVNPIKKEMALDFYAEGIIDYDNRTAHTISSLIGGRIEKLYVKFEYQSVNKGERIFDLYSPELLTAQENLIFLMNKDSGNTKLIDAVKQKLILLGLTKEQTSELMKTKKVWNSIAVFSAWSGHIHAMAVNKDASKIESGRSASSGGMKSGQDNSPSAEQFSNSQKTSELTIKEGMYISAGQTIFNIVDPHQVVVMLQIHSEDVSKISLNQQAEIRIHGETEMVMKGKINFISPFISPGRQTLSVRVDLDNKDHKHKIGTLVTAHIFVEPAEGLWIPAKAVLDLGKEKMVWLKTNGNFTARKIETGASTKDWIEIYSGISARDEIAAEASYLSDSESFIRSTEKENGE